MRKYRNGLTAKEIVQALLHEANKIVNQDGDGYELGSVALICEFTTYFIKRHYSMSQKETIEFPEFIASKIFVEPIKKDWE